MSNADAFADLIAAARPRTKRVQVCTSGDLVARHEELIEQLRSVGKSDSLSGDPEADRILDELDEVERLQEAASRVVVVSSIGRQAWADLLREHPPRPQDKGLDHNPDTFPLAAVAASCGVPVELVEGFADEGKTPVGEWRKLWDAAVLVNVGDMPHPKVPASLTALVRPNGRSSTTSASTGSLAEPSLAGDDSPSPSTTTTTPGG